MLEFMQELWSLFRADTGKGYRLRWPWAMLAFLSIAVFYIAVAPLRALVSWLGRQVHFLRWLRQFDGSAKNIFFLNNRTSDAKGVS